jgi:hypothetical protein
MTVSSYCVASSLRMPVRERKVVRRERARLMR